MTSSERPDEPWWPRDGARYPEDADLIRRIGRIGEALTGFRYLSRDPQPERMPAMNVYKPEKCKPGYTLFCHAHDEPEKASVSGKARIYLIDMEGNVAHEWTTKTAQQSHCRLMPDGNLLYPTRDRSRIESAGLRELDPKSNVLWHYHCRIDHDYQILSNGNLMLHTITDSMQGS